MMSGFHTLTLGFGKFLPWMFFFLCWQVKFVWCDFVLVYKFVAAFCSLGVSSALPECYDEDSVSLRCVVATAFCSKMHHLWLPLCRSIPVLGTCQLGAKRKEIPFDPKNHSVEEIVHEMDTQCQKSFWIYNPLVESCSVDEDFIGRAAFLARSVSPRSTCVRSLERYLVQLMQVWKLDSES